MARRRFARNTSDVLNPTVLLEAEIVYDQTGGRLRVGDGKTPGGAALAHEAALPRRPEMYGPGMSGITAMASAIDTNRQRYMYLPNFDGDQKVTQTITIAEPGVRIFGEQGAGYNRGKGKKGWLEAASGIGRIFDLGASRLYSSGDNPADNWEVDHISLKQAAGVPGRSVDGIAFTARTNGPDRGAQIRNVSFVGLRDAITTENPDLETQLATLSLDGCVITGCTSAINAKGNLLGLHVTNCQIEQNIGPDGVFHGSINGPVIIKGNMLEGQPNVLSIDVPPKTGNRPFVEFSYNYLEANGGDYVIRYRVTAGGSLTVGPNYEFNVQAKDYVVIEDNAGRVALQMNDPRPVTFKNAAPLVEYGSNIFGPRQGSYEVRQMRGSGTGPIILVADFQKFTDRISANAHSIITSGSQMMTPFGMANTVTTNSFITVPLSVEQGDLINLNMLLSASEITAGTVTLQIYDTTVTKIVHEMEISGVGKSCAGRWALLVTPFVAKNASSSLKVRLYTFAGNYRTVIAGVCARNYGAFANDGLSKIALEPATPNVTLFEANPVLKGSVTYAGGVIPAAGPGVIRNLTVNGATVGDFVTASYSTDTSGVVLNGYVSAANALRVVLTNSTGADVTLPSGTIKVRVTPEAA